MSDPYARFIVTKKEVKMFKNICVYCETLYPESVIVCPNCNDYKGLMTISEAKIAYDFLSYLDEK